MSEKRFEEPIEEEIAGTEPVSTHHYFMRQALTLAKEAEAQGEIPVAAVIVKEGVIIAEGFNRREMHFDPTAHAEIIALRQAGERLRNWRLTGCTLYVTLEPCPMCAGALVNARISTLVYGVRDQLRGGVKSHFGIGLGLPLNHTVEVIEEIYPQTCAHLLKQFFARKRQRK